MTQASVAAAVAAAPSLLSSFFFNFSLEAFSFAAAFAAAWASERRCARSFFLLIGATLPSYTGAIFWFAPLALGMNRDVEITTFAFLAMAEICASPDCRPANPRLLLTSSSSELLSLLALLPPSLPSLSAMSMLLVGGKRRSSRVGVDRTGAAAATERYSATTLQLEEPSHTNARGVAGVIHARTPICTGAHWPLQPHHFSHLPDFCPPVRPPRVTGGATLNEPETVG